MRNRKNACFKALSEKVGIQKFSREPKEKQMN